MYKKITLPGNISRSQAIKDLPPGETILLPCNGQTPTRLESSVYATLKNLKLPTKQYKMRSVLLVLDEHTLPIRVVLLSHLPS